jgi:hypothetical protein
VIEAVSNNANGFELVKSATGGAYVIIEEQEGSPIDFISNAHSQIGGSGKKRQSRLEKHRSSIELSNDERLIKPELCKDDYISNFQSCRTTSVIDTITPKSDRRRKSKKLLKMRSSKKEALME